MTARPTFATAAFVVALLGLAASIYAYSSPSTGVDDTVGPLLTALGHVGLALAALLLIFTYRWLGLLVTFFVVVAILTAFAAYLLQQPAILFPALAALIVLPFGLLVGGAR